MSVNQRRGARISTLPNAAARSDAVLFLFTMTIFAIKAKYLTDGESSRFISLLHVVVLDAQVLILAGGLTIFFWLFFRLPGLIHSILSLFLLLLCGVYLVDSLAVVTVNQRLHWSAIAFALEHKDALPEMIPWNMLGMVMSILLGACVLTLLPFFVKFIRSGSVLVVVIAIALSLREQLQPGPAASRAEFSYAFDAQYFRWAFGEVLSNQTAQRTDIYSRIQVDNGIAQVFRLRSPDIDAFPKKVIIVLLESFSAVHSKKVSQLSDNVPWFDELSSRGTLFINHLAAGLNTNYGMASILSGVPPVSAPGFPDNPYYIFKHCLKFSAPLEKLQSAGYSLSFISGYSVKTATVKEDEMRQFGFADVVFPPFNSSPEQFDEKRMMGASDSDLYNLALQKLGILEEQDPKFHLMLEPAAGHALWLERKEPMKVLDPMGRNLKGFVQRLDEKKFFDDGLLIITSDQRWTARISKEESDRSGDSAPFRIPLLLIGKVVASNTVDTRFVHQSDLLVNLPRIMNPNLVVTDSIVSVGSYKNKIIDLFDLNFDKSAFTRIPLVLEGTRI